MATPILMPKQGQSVESCIITEWYKKPGEKVEKGEALFSYETDKASFEETAPESGILLGVFYDEGDEVPVLVNVGAIGKEGEEISHLASQDAQAQENAPKPDEKPQETAQEKPSAGSHPEKGRIKISPLARRKAAKLNVDFNQITGSGPNGRIIAQDIEDHHQKNKTTAGNINIKESKSETLVPQEAVNYTMPDSLNFGYQEEKPSNVRKIIAKNMHQSLLNAAQLTHHMSADARNILAARKKIKHLQNDGHSINITLNDMVCMAVVRALKKHSDVNVHFTGQSIRKFQKIHLGIAVDTPRGLLVPALRDADDLNIEGLSSKLKQLADDAKNNKLNPELLSSTAATFTVSNLGSYGVEMFTPVINLPQAAILGVNTITYRPADLGDGTIGFVPHIGLSLTYDHRVLDGAPASAFLREIKIEVENFKLNL